MNTSRWIIAFLGLGLFTFACEVTTTKDIDDYDGTGGGTSSGNGGNGGETSTSSSSTSSSGTTGGTCPSGQDCMETIPNSGTLGCLLPDSSIPAGNETGCSDSGGCTGNFSCYCLDADCAQSACVGNCGVCPSGQDCVETIPNSGTLGCLLPDSSIPAGNETGCADSGGCTGNFSCYCLDADCAQSVCVGNCS